MWTLHDLQFPNNNHNNLPCSKIIFRSSRPEVFLEKGVLKVRSKFTGEHHGRSAISIKLLCDFNEIVLRHGYSPVNLLRIFRTSFSRNTSGWLLLNLYNTISWLSKTLEYQQAFLFYRVFLLIKLLRNKFFSFSQWTFQSAPSYVVCNALISDY